MSHYPAPNAALPDLPDAHAALERLIQEDVYPPVHHAHKKLRVLQELSRNAPQDALLQSLLAAVFAAAATRDAAAAALSTLANNNEECAKLKDLKSALLLTHDCTLKALDRSVNAAIEALEIAIHESHFGRDMWAVLARVAERSQRRRAQQQQHQPQEQKKQEQ